MNVARSFSQMKIPLDHLCLPCRNYHKSISNNNVNKNRTVGTTTIVRASYQNKIGAEEGHSFRYIHRNLKQNISLSVYSLKQYKSDLLFCKHSALPRLKDLPVMHEILHGLFPHHWIPKLLMLPFNRAKKVQSVLQISVMETSKKRAKLTSVIFQAALKLWQKKEEE